MTDDGRRTTGAPTSVVRRPSSVVLPLAGLRVIDAAVVQAGPFITRLMADLGAEVIRVESRVHHRRYPLMPGNRAGERWWEQAGIHIEQHRNKLGLTLELFVPEAAELFKRLVAVSDVVVESHAASVMRKFGLDYPALRAVRPDLVMVSSTGYGHSGPYGEYRSYGMMIEAMSGLMATTGYGHDAPRRSIIPYPDVVAAYHGAFAVLAALEHRRRTGEGQWIDIAQYETAVSFNAEAVLDQTLNGRARRPIGNRHPTMAPHGVYPGAPVPTEEGGEDRWIAIACRDDRDWAALRRMMGDPAWAAGPEYDRPARRVRRADALDAHLSAWTRPQDVFQLADRLQEAGVPAAPVRTPKDLLLDPHLAARGFWPKVRHHPLQEGVGVRPLPGVAARFTGTPGRVERPAPLLGQHNREILGELLGLSDAELASLAADGVIGDRPASEARPALGPDPPELKALGEIGEYDAEFEARLGVEN
jgi:benzylsuccinate CoA-transferase BbsF subunit